MKCAVVGRARTSTTTMLDYQLALKATLQVKLTLAHVNRTWHLEKHLFDCNAAQLRNDEVPPPTTTLPIPPFAPTAAQEEPSPPDEPRRQAVRWLPHFLDKPLFNNSLISAALPTGWRLGNIRGMMNNGNPGSPTSFASIIRKICARLLQRALLSFFGGSRVTSPNLLTVQQPCLKVTFSLSFLCGYLRPVLA